MANRYNNDDLEGFFRRRLSNYEEIPRPEMWDKIGVAIPPKPPVPWWKKPVFWLGLVLAFVLLLSLWQFRQITAFQKLIHQQQADIEALQEYQRSGYGPDQLKTHVENPVYKVPGALGIVMPSVNVPGANIADQPEPQKDIALLTTIPEIPAVAEFNSPEKKESIAATDNARQDFSESAKAFNKQRTVDFLSHSTGSTPVPPVRPLPGQVTVKPVKGNAGFYFSLNGGTLATVFNNPLNKSRSEVLESNNPGFHLYNTVRDEITLLAGIQFNRKWSLETGVGYRNNRLSLFDAQEFNYSGENTIDYDIHGNPIVAYTNNTDQTPVFRYEIINNLQSQGGDIQEGDPFYLNAFFKYNNRYLSLPLWLKYRIGNRRLHFYAKSGIAWNILTVSNKNLNESSLSDERLSLEKVQIKNDALSETFMEIGFAGGIEYDLGVRTSIGLEALYYHSVGSVLTTKQDAYGLSFAAKYNF